MKMKILHIVNSSKLSGAENVVIDICNLFDNDAEMIYCSIKGSIQGALQLRNVEYVLVKKMNIRNLRKAIKLINPDVIHAHDAKATFLAALVSKKIPLISHLHGNHDDMKRLTLKSVFYYLSLKKVKSIIYVSTSCIEEYYFKNKIRIKKYFLQNIISVNRIQSMLSSSKQGKVYDFIYLGRLEYPKNPERVATVASIILKNSSDYKFAVVGDGKYMETMKNIFTKHGVIDQVDFLGRLANPYVFLSSSKVFLMCSRYEGTPIAVLESLYLGTPVVSTPTDGVKSIITHKINGFLSNKDDELANYVVALIEDSAYRKKISNNSMVLFNKINNIDIYKQELNSIYQKVISKV